MIRVEGCFVDEHASRYQQEFSHTGRQSRVGRNPCGFDILYSRCARCQERTAPGLLKNFESAGLSTYNQGEFFSVVNNSRGGRRAAFEDVVNQMHGIGGVDAAVAGCLSALRDFSK